MFPTADSATRITVARERLLQIQISVALALRVLDHEDVFGATLALDGVDDILAALVRLVV